MAKQNK